MTARLIRRASLVVTMDGPDLIDADILIKDGAISAVGRNLVADGTEMLDASGFLVTPGLVNTHHHLFQTLARAVPGGQDALLSAG